MHVSNYLFNIHFAKKDWSEDGQGRGARETDWSELGLGRASAR